MKSYYNVIGDIYDQLNMKYEFNDYLSRALIKDTYYYELTEAIKNKIVEPCDINVICDETNNNINVIESGIVNVLIILKPYKLASRKKYLVRILCGNKFVDKWRRFCDERKLRWKTKIP